MPDPETDRLGPLAFVWGVGGGWWVGRADEKEE